MEQRGAKPQDALASAPNQLLSLTFFQSLTPLYRCLSTKMADYEDQREENIRRNRELLVSLGLAGPPSFMQPKPKAKRKPAQSKKRQAPSESAADENDEERPKKAAKAVGDGDATEGVRRSSRNKGKTLNYNEDGQSSAAAARALPRVISASAQRAMDSAPRDAMKRTHDP